MILDIILIIATAFILFVILGIIRETILIERETKTEYHKHKNNLVDKEELRELQNRQQIGE